MGSCASAHVNACAGTHVKEEGEELFTFPVARLADDEAIEALQKIHIGMGIRSLILLVLGHLAIPEGCTIENYASTRFKKSAPALKVRLLEVIDAATVVVENIDERCSETSNEFAHVDGWVRLPKKLTIRLSHPRQYDKLPTEQPGSLDDEEEVVPVLLEQFLGKEFYCQGFGLDTQLMLLADLQTPTIPSLKLWVLKYSYERTRPLLPHNAVRAKTMMCSYLDYLV